MWINLQQCGKVWILWKIKNLVLKISKLYTSKKCVFMLKIKFSTKNNICGKLITLSVYNMWIKYVGKIGIIKNRYKKRRLHVENVKFK